jgi:broad specificity phosphatase PhoE
MSEKWKIKHEAMRPLASQAAELVRHFSRVSFRHIPRELNSHADRLANEAMDAAAGISRRPAAKAPAAPAGGWSAPTGTRTTLLLLRHGETPLSVDRRFSGVGDPELTDRGAAQAEAAATRLASYGGITAVVSSPLRRARQTADAVARQVGAEVAVEPGFAETDFGLWEGLTFGEIAERWPREMAAWRADPSVAPPGGESFTETAERVDAARRRVTAAHTGGTVVVVSHVTPIKTLLRFAMDAPAHVLYRIHLDPASLSATEWWDNGAVVRLVNDTSHLGVELRTGSPR